MNTSFNVRGEPIVCTPEDAYLCFMRTEMDQLVLGSFVLEKARQPALQRRRRLAHAVPTRLTIVTGLVSGTPRSCAACVNCIVVSSRS